MTIVINMIIDCYDLRRAKEEGDSFERTHKKKKKKKEVRAYWDNKDKK